MSRKRRLATPDPARLQPVRVVTPHGRLAEAVGASGGAHPGSRGGMRMREQPPDVRTAAVPSARGEGQALAGFVCGLVSVGASLLAGLLAIKAIPGGSSGEALLLLLGMVPVEVAGFALSIWGCHAPSRRGLADYRIVASPRLWCSSSWSCSW